ncbi:hypothetical protein OFN46_34080, partial [Escherichia coli]|nr:hypothetical protein [Escherichia coli]
TLNIFLRLRSRAKFPRNAAEVLGAASILQRRSVQVDIFAGELPCNLTFPKRNEDFFFLKKRRPPRFTLFPYPTLFRKKKK